MHIFLFIARDSCGVKMVSKSRAKHMFMHLLKTYSESVFLQHLVWSMVMSMGLIAIGAFAVRVNAIGYAVLCLFLAQYITTLMLIEGLYEDLRNSGSKRGDAE
jgi:hypothetical protein